MVKTILGKGLEKGSHLITAFQTVGFISVLAVRYLEEKNIIKEIGSITLENDEPIAVIENGEVGFPIKIYEGPSSVFISSQFPVPKESLHDLINELFNLHKKYALNDIIALDGLPVEKGKDNSDVFYVSTKNKTDVEGAKRLEEGAMVGLSAELALRAKTEGLPLTVLMAETHLQIPDGLAAAALLGVLKKVMGTELDTKELVSEYKKTISKINSIMSDIAKKQKNDRPISEIYG